jgi:hypothetical protein
VKPFFRARLLLEIGVPDSAGCEAELYRRSAPAGNPAIT